MRFNANHLRKARRSAGYKRAEDAAAQLGIAMLTLYTYERGDREPRAQLMADMAALYGCKVTDFYDRVEVPA